VLSLAFEAAGLATVGISLVRELTERVRPPRALWVPFPLGRPLGRPHDAALQRRVLDAAFALLTRPAGPVLEDFPEDIPVSGEDDTLVCAVEILAPRAGRDDLAAELAEVGGWYTRGVAKRGRTTVGLSGLTAGEMPRAAALLERIVESGELPEPPRSEWAPLHYLGLVLHDLRAFYQEAALAQPGPTPNPREVQGWLWTDTEMGALVRRLRDRFRESEEPALKAAAATMVPYGF
jgi:hypothetical protein